MVCQELQPQSVSSFQMSFEEFLKHVRQCRVYGTEACTADLQNGTQVQMANRYFELALVDKVEAVPVNSGKEDEAMYMGMMDLFEQQFGIANPLFLRQSAFMKGDIQEGEKLSSYCTRARQESIAAKMEAVTNDNLLTIKIMSSMKEPLKAQIFRELGGVVRETLPAFQTLNEVILKCEAIDDFGKERVADIQLNMAQVKKKKKPRSNQGPGGGQQGQGQGSIFPTSAQALLGG